METHREWRHVGGTVLGLTAFAVRAAGRVRLARGQHRTPRPAHRRCGTRAGSRPDRAAPRHGRVRCDQGRRPGGGRPLDRGPGRLRGDRGGPDPEAPEVLTASAGGPGVAQLLGQVGAALGAAEGRPVQVTDVVPLPEDDPRGAGPCGWFAAAGARRHRHGCGPCTGRARAMGPHRGCPRGRRGGGPGADGNPAALAGVAGGQLLGQRLRRRAVDRRRLERHPRAREPAG